MKHNLRVITRNVPADLETPVGIYLKIRDLYPESALLESSDYHATQNAVSYIGVDPIGSFTVAGEKITTVYPGGRSETVDIQRNNDVTERLHNYISSFSFNGETPHAGSGLFGYTAYDAVRYFDAVDIKPREPQFRDIPDMKYVLFRYIIMVNHYKSELTILEHLSSGESSGIDEILSVINNNNVAQYPFSIAGSATSTVTNEEYKAMVRKGIEHALRGDVFQIVLSRRFEQAFQGDEFNVYRALRYINPSPYLFYFDFSNFKMFGSSPETHLRVEGRNAYIDPIAGTFRRTGDDDRELANALLHDEKENAEHIMLVDLTRNDLSRSGGKISIDFLREVLLELHSRAELDKYTPEADMVGINNRNLTTFDTDPGLSLATAELLPQDAVKVAESGLSSLDEVLRLREAGYRGFMIGESFMKHNNPAAALRNFLRQ